MKLFLDTNIFVEFMARRQQYAPVCQIIDAISNGEHTACISLGSAYTLTYLFELGLKKQGCHRPELTQRIRCLLADVLNLATVVQLSHAGVEIAAFDEAFTDIEDSLQYHCALENRCAVLITINERDFKNVEQSRLEILTPMGFVEKYMKK